MYEFLTFTSALLLTWLQAKANIPRRGLLFAPPDLQTSLWAFWKACGRSMLLSLWTALPTMIWSVEQQLEARQLKLVARLLKKLASTKFGNSSLSSKSYALSCLMACRLLGSLHLTTRLRSYIAKKHKRLGKLAPRSRNLTSVEAYWADGAMFGTSATSLSTWRSWSWSKSHIQSTRKWQS